MMNYTAMALAKNRVKNNILLNKFLFVALGTTNIVFMFLIVILSSFSLGGYLLTSRSLLFILYYLFIGVLSIVYSYSLKNRKQGDDTRFYFYANILFILFIIGSVIMCYLLFQAYGFYQYHQDIEQMPYWKQPIN
jgi:uncharacterized membrane protein